MVGDAATVIAVIVAIYFAVREIDRWHADRSLENALRLEERFHSAKMRQSRARVAGALKSVYDAQTSEDEEDEETAKSEALRSVPDDTQELFNFFELLGYMVRRGIIEQQLAYFLFSQWLIPYWEAAGGAMKAMQSRSIEDTEVVFDVFVKMCDSRNHETLEERTFLAAECAWEASSDQGGASFAYHIVSVQPKRDAPDTSPEPPAKLKLRGINVQWPIEKPGKRDTPIVPWDSPFTSSLSDPFLSPVRVVSPLNPGPVPKGVKDLIVPFSLPTEATPEEITDVASGLGRAGWELITVLPQGERSLWVFRGARA
jgi:hypothetical protein